MKTSPKKQSDSLAKNVLLWIFTAVAVVMFVRLALVALRFAGMAIGWLSEGNIFDQISRISPTTIAIQIAIIVIVVTIKLIATVSRRHPGGIDNQS